MDDLRDKHILVLGLGLSGLAMANWCVGAGAQITVLDNRESPPQLKNLEAIHNCKFIETAFDEASTNEIFALARATGCGIQGVLCSPGLSPATVVSVINTAHKHGAWISNELGLFSRALVSLKAKHEYSPYVLAVTGTNGKTTVTALTASLVARSGRTVEIAGNIGPTMLGTLSRCIADSTLPDVWVLELSSFQLHGVTQFDPTAAVVLNVTQDHFDWHGDMHSYAEAKSRIFGKTTRRVLCVDDAISIGMLPPPKPDDPNQTKVSRVTRTQEHTRYGMSLPMRNGDFGLETVNGMEWLVRAIAADPPPRRQKVEVIAAETCMQRLMPAEALRIRGRHNASNALAALALASTTGATLGPMLYALREYRGEPHRMQSICVVNGVEYFDDSKGTNVGATVAAINSFGGDRQLVVILGGDGKGQNFSALTGPISLFVKAVVLLGRDAKQIEPCIDASVTRIVHVESMQAAVTACSRLTKPGDAVLMSPACASLDMFDNYKHRAQAFFDSVHRLLESTESTA